MSRIKILYILTFIVAFCSIVYELILGQALSLFLGNTILRFSVTIGVYMFAMGIGAMLVEGKIIKKRIFYFIFIEMLLVLIGGFSPILLFFAQFVLGGGFLFLLFALILIFSIGVLTGFEIPLLMELFKDETKDGNSEGKVLGVDYLGAFMGSIVFAIFFYPKFGLLQTTFTIALLNCLVGIFFYLKWSKKEKWSGGEKILKNIFKTQIVFLVVLAGALVVSGNLTESLVGLYLK